MSIKENYSLKKLNTFGIEVKSKFFTEINQTEELNDIFTSEKFSTIPKLVLGGGSNLLFTQDFEGLIIKINTKKIQELYEDEEIVLVQAEAGVLWNDLVNYAISKNYGGIENLSLIPGTVGAAPIQNIGAYGVELKDVFSYLEAFEIATKESKTFLNEECKFGYRDSIFKNELKGKYVITNITLKLTKKPLFNTSYGAIQDTMKELKLDTLSIENISKAVCHIRRTKLPDPEEIGNAGSFFKNPEITEEHFMELKEEFPDIVSYKTNTSKVKIPAGWLIEKCGWKGKTFESYGVHKNQALVLVNYGKAKGNDIKVLSEEIAKSVLKTFKIALETEVNII